MDRVSASETVGSSLIPGRVKPKAIEIGIHSFPAWRSAFKGECEASTVCGKLMIVWFEGRKVPLLSPGQVNLVNEEWKCIILAGKSYFVLSSCVWLSVPLSISLPPPGLEARSATVVDVASTLLDMLEGWKITHWHYKSNCKHYQLPVIHLNFQWLSKM